MLNVTHQHSVLDNASFICSMKWLISLILVVTMQNLMSQDSLIYIGDPMCSWCYGFSDEISKVKEATKGNYEFKLVMGGLRPYNTETMADLGEFLKHHWEQVGERSGKEFKYDILSDKSFVYDTEPPARAVWVMRELKPEVEFDFFKDVQQLFYVDNANTADINAYKSLIEKYGVDFTKFASVFNSNEARLGIKEDYKLSGQMGIKGFPSVVLKRGEEWYLICNGYNTSEELLKIISKIEKGK